MPQVGHKNWNIMRLHAYLRQVAWTRRARCPAGLTQAHVCKKEKKRETAKLRKFDRQKSLLQDLHQN